MIEDIYKVAGDQLTENEKMWISMGIKGRCLFINGYKDRQMLDINIAEYEWLAIGNQIDQKYNALLIEYKINKEINNEWFDKLINH